MGGGGGGFHFAMTLNVPTCLKMLNFIYVNGEHWAVKVMTMMTMTMARTTKTLYLS